MGADDIGWAMKKSAIPLWGYKTSRTNLWGHEKSNKKSIHFSDQKCGGLPFILVVRDPVLTRHSAA